MPQLLPYRNQICDHPSHKEEGKTVPAAWRYEEVDRWRCGEHQLGMKGIPVVDGSLGDNFWTHPLPKAIGHGSWPQSEARLEEAIQQIAVFWDLSIEDARERAHLILDQSKADPRPAFEIIRERLRELGTPITKDQFFSETEGGRSLRPEFTITFQPEADPNPIPVRYSIVQRVTIKDAVCQVCGAPATHGAMHMIRTPERDHLDHEGTLNWAYDPLPNQPSFGCDQHRVQPVCLDESGEAM